MTTTTRPAPRSASSASGGSSSTTSTSSKKPIAAGELRRFSDRLGAAALLDTESRPYREGGLAYLATDTAGITSRLLADSRLIRLPLVRYGEDVTAGRAEPTWKAWLARPK